MLAAWMFSLAWAQPTPVVVDVPVDADRADVYDWVLENTVALPAVQDGAEVKVRFGEGPAVALYELQPRAAAPVKDEPRWRSMPVVHTGKVPGSLTGAAVYVSQCHGWMYFDSLRRFSTQRGVLFDTVEDFHNPEGTNQYLIPYLENAGAMVYTARERDQNPTMVIVDDRDGGYEEDGRTFAADGDGFGQQDEYAHGDNPFRLGGARKMRADSGDVARWRVEVPRADHYAVYVSWKSGVERPTDAHYRLTHPGGELDRWFNQSVHGSTWQYVDTLYLEAGQSLTVELIADSLEGGDWLSVDAVRVGGGMAQVSRAGQVPEVSRWEASAISYTQFNGAPSSVYDSQGNGNGTDHVARSLWADWEHPSGEDAVYLSWHSNASNGSARGTVTYFAGGGADAPSSLPAACSAGGAVEGSYTLARLLQDELYAGLRALQDPSWRHAYGQEGLDTACFSEISPGLQNEMPSALVELAFHDNAQDTAFLKDPTFRRDASRAMYRAVVRYFADKRGESPVFLPEPPVELALVHELDGEVTLSWSPGPSGAPHGDAPTGYVVEASADGLVWDRRFEVSGTTFSLGLADGVTRFVRVVAVNDGGWSFPSEVLGARQSPDGEAPILIVSGFDRLDGTLLNRRLPPYIGEVVHMNLRRMNAYDTVVAHGQAVDALGWPFDSVSDEVFDLVDLSQYQAVWWIAGEESSGTDTITPRQQALLSEYVAGGGKLWVSGAEIFWDLDYLGSESDQLFAEEVLGALLESDAAASDRAMGEGILAGLTMDFSVEGGAPYPVEYPDVLRSTRDVIGRYGDGGVAAVFGRGVVSFGFPFESIGDVGVREDVAARILTTLMPDYEPPAVEDLDTGDWTDDGNETTKTGVAGRRVRLDTLRGCGCAGSQSNSGAGLAMMALLVTLGGRRRSTRQRQPPHHASFRRE